MAHDTDEPTRAELYERARELDIPGRSSMDKAALAAALEERDGSGTAPANGAPPDDSSSPLSDGVASRVEQFAGLAARAAAGEFVMLPRLLTGDDRRLHVRQTLREDHTHRIAGREADTEAKFDKLAGSAFSFFRGTSLLFYRDMAGTDAWMPTVLTLGDVHPGNFGVMPNADNVPVFGVNDFDDACTAPFTWDLRRGTAAFLLAASDIGGLKSKKARKVARRFVRGYVEGMRRFAEDGNELDHQLREDNAPELVAELIEDACRDRAAWLKEDYLDEYGRGFRSDDELVPVSGRRGEFQGHVDRLARDNGIDLPARVGDALTVKDVAIRRGQGTASLGLPRYYVLIEGARKDASDDLIVEFKRARTSALDGLAPSRDRAGVDAKGDRIANAQAVQLVSGDVFYGSVDIDGQSFMTRERSPFRDDVDLDDLDAKDWKRYARICGTSLAHAHALSDELGDVARDIEPVILEAIGPEKLFVDDMLRFAEEAVARLRADHEHFRSDHARGAFRNVDRVYR